jgi:hypothetical protein
MKMVSSTRGFFEVVFLLKPQNAGKNSPQKNLPEKDN